MNKFLNKFFNNEKVAFWIFVSPALIALLILIFLPLIFSFALSFCDWNLLSDIKFVKFANYIDLFKNPVFFKILNNTFIFAFFTVVFSISIPLMLAAILNKKIRGSEFFKTAYFLPFITPMVVAAVIWQWIFDPNFGLVNTLLKLHINWLYSPETALIAIIFVSAWKLIGYNLIIFLSGFSSIPQTCFESAKIDGASSVKIFFNITLPLLSPTIFFVTLITVISSFQVFDLIYLMTSGGPQNSTNVLVYWVYQNAFEFFDVGKASAVAYVLFFIVLILSIIQWKIRKKWVLDE